MPPGTAGLYEAVLGDLNLPTSPCSFLFFHEQLPGMCMSTSHSCGHSYDLCSNGQTEPKLGGPTH